MTEKSEKKIVLTLSRHEAAFLAAVMHSTHGSPLSMAVRDALVPAVGATAVVKYYEQMKGHIDVVK